jgi:predicted esterase
MTSTPDFIHRFVPGNDAPAPVLLLLHGTGGNENDLIPLGSTLRAGAPLLSPRGRTLENGMPRFFRRLAEGVFDEEDLIKRTHELADFVASARLHYQLQRRKLVAVGYSNGANIAASMLLLRPEVLDGAILFRAMLPLVPKEAADVAGMPVFLSGGRADPIIPAESTDRLAQLLQAAGASVELVWSSAGHRLTTFDIEGGKRWLTERFP